MWLTLSVVDTTVGSVKISVGGWQLVGFSVSVNTNGKVALGVIFGGTKAEGMATHGLTAFDFIGATVLRVGDSTNSFIGDVFSVRIMTPGGGFVPNTACSPDHEMELDSSSFPLICNSDLYLNSLDNLCYTECPSETTAYSDTPVKICAIPPKIPSPSSGSKNEEGLSDGTIAGIVIGTVVMIVIILASINHVYRGENMCFLTGAFRK